jgi:transcription-repair coupling factor (superfamily II helicase)
VEQSLALRETEAAADFAALLENGEASAGDWARFVPAEGYFDILARRAACIVTPYGDLPEASADAARRGQDRGQGGLRGGLRTVSYEAKYPAAFFGQMDLLSAELKRYLRLRFEITIVCSTRERLDHLRAFAEEEGFGGRIAFAEGELTAGCEITSEKLVWLWDGDIFKSEKKSRRRGLRSREKIAAFADIQAGDYVVHEKHGIGVYGGIKTIEVGGVSRDYLSIAYAGKDVLYVPAEQMDVVQRYIGGGESRPKVSKLGSDEWTRTKTRVRAEVEVYAAELLKLAAERKLAPGHAFSPDTVWQKDFEDRFPWEPTSDQIRCFDAVRTDMENPWPMDRLICGDVGYGKTEVALRAVFKCVSDSKQAAVLVPTTILASQHYRTFSERFGDFPVRTEMLSRFQTPAKQKEILKGLADGSVDIVIGTHALLGANVAFKGLGLLVIDEEQRFGVRHKERVRALRVGVDVLTLTATPIPRTLNMSLLGIKDMELIEEPPEDRHPVRTYVSEQRDDVIAESIRRELDRGGQVYVVFNRVSGIERAGEYIAALTPGARVGVCHAQMNERVIEEIMMDFCEGDYDILVSTTIIESGLDIPNVNTILILDADRLGLTQLYQLRGRVGRRDRIAFAYLLYRRDKVLTETAQKRLRTIREFTEFGSGFKIAMKDLEIRGAGNLLGVSQHGHMTAVGYELYCKLMDDAVSALTGGGGAGRAMAPEEECHLDLDVSAVVPSKYIEDEVVKLQVYKRISTAAGEEDAEALLAELDDRFGSVPPSVKNLAYIAVIKHLSDRIGLAEVSLKGNRAVFTYREAPEGFPEKVFRAADAAAGRLTADIKSAPRLRQTLTAAEGAAKLAEMLAVLRALLL